MRFQINNVDYIIEEDIDGWCWSSKDDDAIGFESVVAALQDAMDKIQATFNKYDDSGFKKIEWVEEDWNRPTKENL